MTSSTIIDDFIERAQCITVTEAAASLNLPVRKGDRGGPCPQCGGKDRFSINTAKQVWNCRGCDRGGKTGINLAGHVLQLDLHSRTGLMEACSAILGEAIPDGGERESDDERVARMDRMAESRRRASAHEAEQAEKQNAFREKEVNRARGIYLNALVAPHRDDNELRRYLRLRTGYDMHDGVFECIRFDPRHTYWQGQDEFGRPRSHHVGFAMVAPFVDLEGRVTGCHETWIDLSHGPKFRPYLGRDEKGEAYPTKKMRGTKMGSLIPVCGDMAATRWVGGEGIENAAAIAGYEGFSRDTFYFAAGDLGNLAGPAERKSFFKHPTLKKTDVNGRAISIQVPGPVPRADQSPSDAMRVPPHVSTLVMLADGDSEFMFTAAAMARAKARHSLDGRHIGVWWPARGKDFAGMLSERRV